MSRPPSKLSKASKMSVVPSFYRVSITRSKYILTKYKHETDVVYNMQELNPYSEGEWKKLEPKEVRSTHTNEDVTKEEHQLNEPDDDRIKKVQVLRGPKWNYGVRKISGDADYYKHILFGLPGAGKITPDDMILRGTTWVPKKPITISMAKFVMKKFKKLGYEKTALVEVETGRSITYGEMADKVESLACGLQWLGVQPNQIMAIVSYHSLEAHLMLLACLLVGAVAALVDSSLNPAELGILLRITCPNFLFTEAGKTLDNVHAVLSYLETSLHSCKPLLIINSTSIAPFPEYVLYTQLLKEVNPLEPVPIPRKADPVRPVLILYTGTGEKLRACLIPESYFTLSIAFMESMLPNSDEPSITVMVTPPMYCALAIKTVFNHYIDGHRIILSRGLIPDPSLLTALRKFEVFAILTLRSTLMSLLDWPARPRCPKLKLVAVAGMPLRLKNLKKVNDNLFRNKVQIIQLYGVVEVGTTATNTFLENKKGSVGKLFYNVEMKVLEEGTGLTLGCNQEGELCVRSPTMMLGYHNNPEANKEVIDPEGFVHTGDLGYYDEEGFVHVTSETRETIKWRTYLVSPSLVEETLMELPAIKEALVFGLFDEEDGELVSAAVILESEYGRVDVSALEKQANALLPDHRKIRGGIHVFKQFPRSTIGKPMREYILKDVIERRLISQRRKSSES